MWGQPVLSGDVWILILCLHNSLLIACLFLFIIDDYAHVTIPFHTGMSETVGPQALLRCIPAKTCAENHQVPVTVEGNASCLGLQHYGNLGYLKLVRMWFIGDAEMQQELRGHGRTGGSFGNHVGHHKICQWFNAPNCHHWLWGIYSTSLLVQCTQMVYCLWSYPCTVTWPSLSLYLCTRGHNGEVISLLSRVIWMTWASCSCKALSMCGQTIRKVTIK